MNRDKKPTADEQRGRRFVEAMRSRYNWRRLTGQQLEQVLDMAEEYHAFMERMRARRKANP